MSALDELLNDVASAAVAGGGSLDIGSAIKNVEAARAELAALRSRLALADAMAEAAAEFECVNLNARHDAEIDTLVTALAAYRASEKKV